MPEEICPVPKYGDFRRTDWTKVRFHELKKSGVNGSGKRFASKKTRLKGLLNALFLGVPANQRIEDGQDMPPVFDHAVEDVAEFRVALGVSVPLDHDGLWYFDVAAQLVGRMAAQEQTIEKRRFPLLATYDHVLKCSNLFNTLDARGAISVTERVGVIGRVRKLAVDVASSWVEQAA